MLRQLLAKWLKADLTPSVNWTSIQSHSVLFRTSVRQPQLFGKQLVEQVLCETEQGYELFSRWTRSGRLSRILFDRSLDARQMRLTDMTAGAAPVWRLQLMPGLERSVRAEFAHPTWFGLWHNERHEDLGGSICFVESEDRNVLAELRLKLLGGELPEALRTEEAMWEQMNRLSETDRRAAYAALAMQSMQQLDQRFEQMHPDLGEIPDELKPMQVIIDKQRSRIEGLASANPVAPELEGLMQRFVADAAGKTLPPDKRSG
jgi:hypothetical protein